MKDNATPAHLRQHLGQPDKEPPESELSLPDGDEVYLAYGRATNKPIFAVHFIKPDGNVASFQYMHLDSWSRFEHDTIHLQFLGLRPVSVVIAGRNLRTLYDYLHQHRTAWVMEIPAGRDFVSDGQPVVSNIKISLVEE